MNLKYLQREDMVTLIDYYKRNTDRLELINREIQDLEEKLGVQGIDTSKERGNSSSNYRMQLFFEIDELMYQKKYTETKLCIVDDFINWLSSEYTDEYCHEIVSLRANKVQWEQIADQVKFSYNNTRHIFNKGIDHYLKQFKYG